MSGAGDSFVVSYNSNGIARWCSKIGGTLEDSGLSITSDNLGNIYVAGNYKSIPTTFYSSNDTTFTTLTNAGFNYSDGYVVKYNTNVISL